METTFCKLLPRLDNLFRCSHPWQPRGERSLTRRLGEMPYPLALQLTVNEVLPAGGWAGEWARPLPRARRYWCMLIWPVNRECR